MVKVFFVLAGNTQNTQAQFWQRLVRRGTNAVKVANIRDCDVTLTFCPIVSRVGTDVEAAVQLIPSECLRKGTHMQRTFVTGIFTLLS